MEKKIVPIIESYNVDEEYLYSNTYLFLKGVAVEGNYIYTLKALPLARKFHNGQHRLGYIEIKGEMVQPPYILHVLKVCSTLKSLNLPLTHDELDLLYTCALLHDSLEDAEEYFPNGGTELITDYGFPKEVYEIVKLLSKHSGADQYELSEYFNAIKKNKLALLIKLSDRSHNVEDLYNMKIEKIHKYVKETKDYILPLCSYAKQNYPELSNGITILKSKIRSLTDSTETIVNKFEAEIRNYKEEIKRLQEELNHKKAKESSDLCF